MEAPGTHQRGHSCGADSRIRWGLHGEGHRRMDDAGSPPVSVAAHSCPAGNHRLFPQTRNRRKKFWTQRDQAGWAANAGAKQDHSVKVSILKRPSGPFPALPPNAVTRWLSMPPPGGTSTRSLERRCQHSDISVTMPPCSLTPFQGGPPPRKPRCHTELPRVDGAEEMAATDRRAPEAGLSAPFPPARDCVRSKLSFPADRARGLGLRRREASAHVMRPFQTLIQKGSRPRAAGSVAPVSRARVKVWEVWPWTRGCGLGPIPHCAASKPDLQSEPHPGDS